MIWRGKYASRVATKLILRYLGPMTLGGELTYAQLLAQVNRFAAALHSLGVRKGDRIAIMVPNLPQFVISFYGGCQAGRDRRQHQPDLYQPRDGASVRRRRRRDGGLAQPVLPQAQGDPGPHGGQAR